MFKDCIYIQMERIDRIEAAIIELQKSQAKTDLQIAETSARIKETDAQIKETNKILSNIGINLEHVAEEFFYYSLKDHKKLGKIQFDDIEMNVKAKIKNTQDEFDLVLYNGDAIGLLEIKHKVHPNDIEKLKTKKIENFKTLFPFYANYKFYLGIGGMSIPKEVADLAHSSGIAILRQKGETVEIDYEVLTAY